jgi:hypothetical protein
MHGVALVRQITILPGSTRAEARVPVFDNFWSDGARTVQLTLTRADGTHERAVLTITDDEDAATVRCP